MLSWLALHPLSTPFEPRVGVSIWNKHPINIGGLMIEDLLTPDAHDDPYIWGAVLLAHGFICQAMTLVLMLSAVGPVSAAVSVSLVYLVAWEGMHLRAALRRGDGVVVAVADGVLDAVGVALGCFTVAFAAMWLLVLACASAASLLVVAAVGYWRRHG